MEHRSGTFFSGISVYASRISIADRGAAMNPGSWSSRSSSTAAAAQQQWWRRRRVAVFGPSTPGQTRTPNEENGTPKRDIFSGLSAYYALRISIADRAPRCIADRGTAEAAAQQQQHSSSSTAAAAQQQWWQRRRGYGRKGRARIHR